MQMLSFSIYDTAAGIFHAPFYVARAAEALRAFSDLANDPQTSIGRHPADYCLFLLGAFVSDTAEFIPHDGGPKSLGLASALVKRPNEAPLFPVQAAAE